MTTKQITLAVQEAPHYSDPDAFISETLLSAVFLPPEDETAQPDMRLAPELRAIWTAVNAPFRDFLSALGLTQTELSRRYCIPIRTVNNWCAAGSNFRSCPIYLRLLLAQSAGLIRRPE